MNKSQWLFEATFNTEIASPLHPYANYEDNRYFELQAPPEPPPYQPSIPRRNFEAAVASNTWRDAFLNLNGLNMFELLRSLDELSVDRRNQLICARPSFLGLVDIPRIDYALSAIQNDALPASPPGNLPATGQVQTVQEFLSERKLRQATVNVAMLERDRWRNGVIREKDAAIGAVLREYWGFGVGENFTEAQLRDEIFQNGRPAVPAKPGKNGKPATPAIPAILGHPWSAAFISWVMKKAGAGNRFRYSSAHAVYIAWAKQNRLANNREFYKAYRVNEIQPRLGDLVCFSRGKVRATYDNIRPGMETHCDLIVAMTSQVRGIGGNVSDSVTESVVPVNGLGFIDKPECFAIIRLSAPST